MPDPTPDPTPSPATAYESDRLVIASVPANHPYVDHIAPEGGSGPVRLPDPDPAWPERSGVDRWWPPAMLQPAWVRAHDVDLAHLHFGFDDQSPQQLRAWLAALWERRTAFVLTIHDLRNPHHADRAAHDAALDVLVPSADALITLTQGAAAEIAARWGRQARVIAHPHVVDLDTLARFEATPRTDAGTGGAFRVGLHLKSLRANTDPLRVLPTLVETVADLPGAVLAVNGHHDLLDPAAPRHHARLADYLRDAAGSGQLELHLHDYLSDDDLWAYLRSLDVSVLPYRFGTHSGWVEACRDLGTTVVAPTCGFFAEQGPLLSYMADEARFEPGSLSAAVRRAYEERSRWEAGVAERRRQRTEIAAAHDEVYAAALAHAGRRDRAGRGERESRGATCVSA